MLDVMNIDTNNQCSSKSSNQLLRSYDSEQLLKLIKDVKFGKDTIEKSGFQVEFPAVVERYLEKALDLLETGERKGADSVEDWNN